MNCNTCRFADVAGHFEPCETCMRGVEQGRGFTMYEQHGSKPTVIPVAAVDTGPWKALDAAMRGAT